MDEKPHVIRPAMMSEKKELMTMISVDTPAR